MKQTIEVRPVEGKGLGVFASKPFKEGVLVVVGRLERIVKGRTDYSFQVEVNKHVQLDKPARLINHSCEPNLGVRNNKFGGYSFVAIKNIGAGEELTWDYCMTEFVSIAVKDNCMCRSNKCRTRISGYVCLPIDVKNRYNNFVASYLRSL